MTASDERRRVPGQPQNGQPQNGQQPHAVNSLDAPPLQQVQWPPEQVHPHTPEQAAPPTGHNAPQAYAGVANTPPHPQHHQAHVPEAPAAYASPQQPPQAGSSAAAPTDIYGRPSGYHYPEQDQQASPAPEPYSAPAPFDPAVGLQAPIQSGQAPQFDTYQPPQQPVEQPPTPHAQAAPYQSDYTQVAPPATNAMQEPGAAQPASFGHGSAQHGFDVGAYAAPAAAGAADPHAWVDPLAQPQQPQPGLDTHQPAQGGYQGQDFLQSNEQQSQAQQTADAFQSPSYDPSAGYQQQNSNTYADPALDPYGYQPPEMAPDHGGLESVSQSHELDGQYGEDYDDEMYDEPPRGRRSLVVVGALVGAIAVGGGLAYGYKSILGSGPASQTAKVVRSNSAPAKVKPSDPGGKKFAHSDSKVLGRLGDKTGSSTTSSSGTRKVSTLSIGRDGVIRGGAAAGATAAGATGPAQAAADDTDTGAAEISAPGISVVDAFAGRPPAADSAAVKKQASKATSSAAKPIIIAETRPTTVAPSKKATPKPAQLGGSSVAPSAGTKVAARKPAPKPATSSGGATRNGYVVVLASVPVSSTSRVKALTQYANIQQKYGTVLSGKTPDVVEANLGAKGTYHRLLVGPPGSRTSASRLCSSLKAAGYSGCWVTAY